MWWALVGLMIAYIVYTWGSRYAHVRSRVNYWEAKFARDDAWWESYLKWTEHTHHCEHCHPGPLPEGEEVWFCEVGKALDPGSPQP